jgi:CDP-diacylglycerol--glycerol-3-phosphate 3-phosphatidyltransferase
MTTRNRRLLPESLQNAFMNLLAPLIKVLARWGVNPNSFTLAGVVITSMAAAALMMGHLRIGGLLILIGGLCDSIDGSLARSTGRASRFGALFDSAIDRYSEFVMFLGMVTYFAMLKDYSACVVTFIALCGSIMVSYTRARAESLGFESGAGFMQRAERIALLGFGALVHPLAFKLSIWFVAIFANYTALQRIRHAYQQNVADNDRKPKTDR